MNMNKILICIILFSFSEITNGISQGELDLPDSFSEKADRMGIEFYYPIETRIKRKKNYQDDFLQYDLVLKSKKNFEIRYFLYPNDDPKYTEIHPNIEITRTIASIATNDETENIRMNPLSDKEALERFNADWGVYADFVPKESFSRFKIGRIVSVYREDRGFLNCIILYKKDNLDRFMGMPMKFVDTIREEKS